MAHCNQEASLESREYAAIGIAAASIGDVDVDALTFDKALVDGHHLRKDGNSNIVIKVVVGLVEGLRLVTIRERFVSLLKDSVLVISEPLGAACFTGTLKGKANVEKGHS